MHSMMTTVPVGSKLQNNSPVMPKWPLNWQDGGFMLGNPRFVCIPVLVLSKVSLVT